MFWRSSSEAELAAAGLGAPFTPAAAAAVSFAEGRVPGCRDCKPRGVSSTTLKCPVNGGAKVAGRVSGSTYSNAV